MEYPEDWDNLPKRERKKRIKGLKKQKEKHQAFAGKLRSWGIGLAVLVVIGGGGYYWLTSGEVLPPTDFAGHVEQSPASHVLDKPMLILVQKHMLEHADGSGPPGVIINYNCEDFNCSPDLIDQLSEIADQYPKFVYVAPYLGMTEKLAITKFRKIETFDSLDKEALVNFIKGK